jgi:hypothetical protein
MNRWWACLFVVLLGISWTGCARWQRTASGDNNEDAIPEQVDFALADLLTAPRSELAAKCQELEERVRTELQAQSQGKLDLTLLRDERISLDVPVFEQAVYSEQLNFSLPPYAGRSDQDYDIALHLARYGDGEAARKLVAPDDARALARIDELLPEKNYPVEWTRLVGLMQISARVRLATNDPLGAAHLIQIHRQLRDLLDDKALGGPLGAALLGGGRKTLEAAVPAWRTLKHPGQAAQVQAALQEWGEVPPWSLPMSLDSSAKELTRMLHGKQQQHVILPDVSARALDLLALPVPRDDIENVFLWTDAAGHFGEAVVVYHPRTSEFYHSLANMAVHFEEQGQSAHASGDRWLRRQDYEVAGLDVDFMLPLKGTYLGAMVRFHNKEAQAEAELTRDFGPVQMDRSFELDRWLLAPKVFGEPVRTEKPDALASLFNPLAEWPIAGCVLKREGRLNVLESLTLSYEMDHGRPPPFSKLTERCWAGWGPARIEEEPGQVENMKLTWENKETRYTVRIPIGLGPIAQFVADNTPPVDEAALAQRVETFDRKERLTRLADGRPLIRIPRQLEYGEFELGTKRSKAADVFRRAAHFRLLNRADLLMATFDGEADPKAPFVARECFIRSDAEERIVEIRVRYQDRPGGPSTASWAGALLGAWKARCGAPVEIPSPWATVWSDFPPGKPAAAMYRWNDDRSLLTFQVDNLGVEIALRDCPRDQPEGVPLPPLQYLARGPEGYAMGAARADLVPNAPPPPTSARNDVLTVLPTERDTYDELQLHFDGNRKLVRVVARHTGTDAQKLRPDQLTDQLLEVWTRHLTDLGWTRRQDFSAKQYLEDMGWQDECTRLRTYWDKVDGQLRIYSEWKDLTGK